MYFNFDESRPDTPRLDRSLTRLEQILLTLLAYMVIVIAAIFGPRLPFVREIEAKQQAALQERLKAQQDLRDRSEFVFVQPKIDIVTKVPPKLAELSDKNRKAQTIERAPEPKNPLPFSRGTSAERVIADASRSREKPAEQPQPASKGEENGAEASSPQPSSPNSLNPANSPEATMAHNTSRPPLGAPSGVLSDAIRHVERYTGGETLQNVQGQGDYGPSIQFDTKGVEFGPWLRRFIAQIKRNWFVPYAAMSLHGHVVLQFNVHKSGAITDLRVVQPSAIDAFTNSAFHAIQLSNPTMPLPPEYPDDQALFTVTFYFNETPPGGGS
ncbi:MAG TPA: TonB family protein [Vicinamibacterales bacterium]|jgi:TonB family protein|nr:TonB family protein [Vicinamibacterales bacterium]